MMTNDDRVFDALEITPTQHELVMPFARLVEWLGYDPDPDRRATKHRKGAEQAETTNRDRMIHQWRLSIQRPFSGAKRANVPRYRAFIRDMIDGRHKCDTPEITLYAGPRQLRFEPVGPCGGRLSIPLDTPLVALDGETQIAARCDLLMTEAMLGASARVVVRVHHGIDVETAEQIFFTCNRLSVSMPAAFAMSRDHTNPVTEAARRYATFIGPDWISPTQNQKQLSLLSLQQAVLWAMYRRTNEHARKPQTFADDLAKAVEWLDTRIPLLLPLLEQQPLLRRSAVFIAATDPRLSILDIEAINPDESFWAAQRKGVTTPIVNAVIEHLMQTPLPYEGRTESSEAH